jgi:hypothetical protein
MSKPIKFPTGDAAMNRLIMRRIYARALRERIPPRNIGILIVVGMITTGLLIGLLDLIFQYL